MKKSIGIKHLLGIIFFIVLMNLSYAQLSLDIQPKAIQLGQTARLIITQEGIDSSNLPNLIPLQANFSIIGTQRSTNYTVVNGQASSSNQWIIILQPKKVGLLTIPPIKVGKEYTQATVLKVGNTTTSTNSVPDDDAAQTQEVMLKAEINNMQPYINEQVLYTVKLYSRRNLINASYEPPSVENGLFIPIGDGRHYQTDENGKIYSVEEQQYVFFPQHKGLVTIHPPSLKALIYDAIPKPIQIMAKELTFTVQPPPNEFKSLPWLPAKKVILTEQFDTSKEQLEKGATVTRLITFKAIGYPAQLLPQLNFSSTDSFSVYPEKATEKNTFQYNEIVGSREIKVTYLLNHPGKITLPAIKIVWFNTATRKKEVVELPEKIITVRDTEKPALINQDFSKTPTITSVNTPAKPVDNSFAWWVAGGFALAWLLTLTVIALRRWPVKRKPKEENDSITLKNACLKNDPHLAKIKLLAWAKTQWPDKVILSLADLDNLNFNPELNMEIQKLIEATYGSNDQNWQGNELWQWVLNYKQKKPIKEKKNQNLPPLNP